MHVYVDQISWSVLRFEIVNRKTTLFCVATTALWFERLCRNPVILRSKDRIIPAGCHHIRAKIRCQCHYSNSKRTSPPLQNGWTVDLRPHVRFPLQIFDWVGMISCTILTLQQQRFRNAFRIRRHRMIRLLLWLLACANLPLDFRRELQAATGGLNAQRAEFNIYILIQTMGFSDKSWEITYKHGV